MQLQTLLEGVGGEETAGLLDSLAKLSETERSLVIPLISKAINSIANGDKRVMSAKDQELKQFEDALFEDVLAALEKPQSSSTPTKDIGPRLAVVPGGKSPIPSTTFKKPVRIPALIDLAKARESRKNRSDDFPRDLA